jgi:DNA-binding CsgD family transcriptional regulator
MEGEFLRESDVRGIVCALAEVGGLEVDLATKRRMLLERLAKLIDADCWFWTMMGEREPGEMATFSVYLKGGFTEEQFAKYIQAQEHPEMAALNAPFMEEFAREGGHITRLRQQIDVENRFPETAVYDLWREADLAPLIFSMRPTSSGQASGVLMFRKFDRPLFTERESRIAHIILTEVPWLHDESWPNHPQQKLAQLSPRLNTVTNLLLQGRARKDIADSMGISIHTLNGYIKDLYARFEVHSQGEFIRRFVEGDGGDQPHAA